jgi:type II secretory pathway pseudopilin PulG
MTTLRGPKQLMKPGKAETVRIATTKSRAPQSRLCAGPRRSAFTLIELLVVISVIILLAGLTVGGVTRITQKARESKVRAELNQYVTAIESYKEAVGIYPPDNPADAARNPLYYELVGVVVDNQRGEFRAREDGDVIRAADVKTTFGVDGFANAVTDRTKVRNFARELKASQHAPMVNGRTGNEVLKVPIDWPRKAAQHPIPETPGLNPWRYRAGQNAVHNKDSFDLWAEFVAGKHVRVLGNWSSEILIDRPFVTP